MADNILNVYQQQKKPIKLKKWKVRKGITVSVGRIIFIYEETEVDKVEAKKWKTQQAGIIHKILAKENDTVQPGQILFEIKPCTHPTIMIDMCAECGADLRKDSGPKSTASVPMVHAIPDLKVSEEQAQKIGKADTQRLIETRKLVLLVDLDQTLIHTTNDSIPPNIKDVYHFQLYGPKSIWYHTRLRPSTMKFLNSVCDLYELHICTFGTRNYAHTIAMILDPDQKFFGNRILSRDECFDSTSKKANLSALFPCGDQMVCIIDDREDVWSNALNLIRVKPYHFFQHTGDINAPPGLDKHENDDKEGVDLTKIAIKPTDNEKQPDSEKLSDGNNVNKSEVDEAQNANTNLEVTENDSKEKVSDKSEVDDADKNEAKESPPEEETSKKTEADKSDVLKAERTRTNEEIKGETDSEKTSDEKKENQGTVENTDDKSSKTAKNGEVEGDDDNSSENKDTLIDIEDPDDYLIYLEDILKRIHEEFYKKFDQRKNSKETPDLKEIIPEVRKTVLKGYKLVFSGLVPTHYNLEDSRAYQVARSLGAEVFADLDERASHLVAVRPGTVKVNSGRRMKNLKIVTPDWLWCCAERWDHVHEAIFPLNAKGSKNRNPPPHCSSPEHISYTPENYMPALRKRSPSGRFMDSINPLMSFSSDDIADMDKEVEDILDNESDESEDEIFGPYERKVQFENMIQKEVLDHYNEEADICSKNDDEGIINKKLKRKHEQIEKRKEELPSIKFRRGEFIDNELDMDSHQDAEDNDSDSLDEANDSDEGEWNMMGEALEREFLSE